MKKPILIISSLLVAGVLIYIVPRVQGARVARPLNGIFEVEMKCMGGHEIFLELAGSSAFENCPRHRDRKRIGGVVRDAKSATVMDPRDGKPWFRIEWDGERHSLVFLKPPDSSSNFGMIPVRGEIRQVSNPWRLWLPRLLPED